MLINTGSSRTSTNNNISIFIRYIPTNPILATLGKTRKTDARKKQTRSKQTNNQGHAVRSQGCVCGEQLREFLTRVNQNHVREYCNNSN